MLNLVLKFQIKYSASSLLVKPAYQHTQLLLLKRADIFSTILILISFTSVHIYVQFHILLLPLTVAFKSKTSSENQAEGAWMALKPGRTNDMHSLELGLKTHVSLLPEQANLQTDLLSHSKLIFNYSTHSKTPSRDDTATILPQYFIARILSWKIGDADQSSLRQRKELNASLLPFNC